MNAMPLAHQQIGRADNDGVLIYDAGDDCISVVTAADNLFQGGGNGSEVFTVSNTGDVTATSFTGNGSGLTGIIGDNLGNHTATQNLQTNGNWLSGDGGNEGLFVQSDGDVGIGINSPNEVLEIGGAGHVFIGDGGGANRSGLLIDANETGDYIRLQAHNYGTPPSLMDINLNPGNENVGIGTYSPARKLHIDDVMRLEPRSSAPSSPGEGDLYVNSTNHHIYCYLNGAWKQLD